MAHPRSSEKEPSSRSSNKFSILTLFPEILSPFLSSSILGRAQASGAVEFNLIQIRDFATDKHRTVDDTPYGGGEGMLLRPDVLYGAWKQALPQGREPGALTLLMSPQGTPLNQDLVKELSTYSHLVLVCGHYEGVDERFIEKCVDREISVGDYVLTGGELPALTIADAVTRILPGVVGNQDSVSKDSFEQGLLKYPQYTKPREFEGMPVPEVLLSGNHQAIEKWRTDHMKSRTRRKRPDLWEKGKKTIDRS